MNVLLYALAAGIAVVLAIRVPIGDRTDPVRRAFSWLCTVLGGAYLSFTLYLLPGLGVFKYLHSAFTAFLPLALLAFIDRFFERPDLAPDPRRAQLALAAPAVAIAFPIVDFVFYRDRPHASPAELFYGLFVFGAFTIPLRRLWALHDTATRRVDRARIRYLAALVGLALGFSLLEAAVRSVGVAPSSALSFLTRPVLLQGAFPPLGAIFASIFIYFLHQIITVQRLLDLAEIFSRIAAVAIAGAALVGLEALSAAALLGAYPVHGAFQVFLASCLFLLVWDPLRKTLESWINRVINRRGVMLADALHDVDAALARVISLDGFGNEVIAALERSARVTSVSLYLWDEERRAYRLRVERGSGDHAPVPQIPRQPFTDGFAAGQRVYVRASLAPLAARAPAGAEAAQVAVLDDLGADLVVPFRAGDVVLGWLAIRDQDDVEAFTEDEVTRLVQTASRAAVTLENLQGFEKLKEEHRLAALGTMAAGLAHEIRNPLAGIKGAAQFLQAGRKGADAEMVTVIIDEVDRLGGVVTQFLDYARPFQLTREPTDIRRILARARAILEADDTRVAIGEDLGEDLPEVPVDGQRLVQVFLNLLQNAVHAVRGKGTVVVRARVGRLRAPRARDAAALEVAVVDTGSGIAPEDLDKLFVPFFTTRHEGTGLGLAISRRIVQAHGGELDVASRLGEGSTFTVRLPLGPVG